MKISVLINNYNYARFLPECINSVLGQSYANKEIIVVDDGSTDNSRAVIESFGDKVKAIFKPNGGQASALNAGFFNSSGELVIFLDSDDYLEPDALSIIASTWKYGLAKIHWRMKKVTAGGHPIGIIPKLKWPLSTGDVSRLQFKYGLISKI